MKLKDFAERIHRLALTVPDAEVYVAWFPRGANYRSLSEESPELFCTLEGEALASRADYEDGEIANWDPDAVVLWPEGGEP